MARTQTELAAQMIGSQALEIARLMAENETLKEDNAALKSKLPIETAVLHEAKKKTA